jgi:hypothetical protein
MSLFKRRRTKSPEGIYIYINTIYLYLYIKMMQYTCG